MINHNTNSNTILSYDKNTVTWKLENVPSELADLAKEISDQYVESQIIGCF